MLEPFAQMLGEQLMKVIDARLAPDTVTAGLEGTTLQAALDFLASHPEYPFDGIVADWQPLAAIEQVPASTGSPGHLRLGIRPGR